MNDTAEITRIKADHQVARMEHEREMALLDGQALAKMSLPLRLIFDDRLREKIERAAIDMSEARGFTPPHLLGKTAACKVVLVKAIGWNLDPYAVANATYELPNGRVGFEGVLYRAIAESSGLIVGEFHYQWYGEWDRLPRPSFKMVPSHKDPSKKVPKEQWEFFGELEHGLGITVSATIAATGETRSIDFDLVDAYPRNATTWPTRPKLQIINPATRAFVMLVKPSLLMGVHFRDTPEDAPEMRDVTPTGVATTARQPMMAPSYVTVYSQHGEEFSLLPHEITDWYRQHARECTADELDVLIENNPASNDVIAAVEAEVVRRSGGEPGPLDAPPSQSQPRHEARGQREAPENQNQPPAVGETATRSGRRTYEQIKNDLIAAIGRAQTGGEIEALMDSKEYSNRSSEMKAEIDEAANRRYAELAKPRKEVMPDSAGITAPQHDHTTTAPEPFEHAEKPADSAPPGRIALGQVTEEDIAWARGDPLPEEAAKSAHIPTTAPGRPAPEPQEWPVFDIERLGEPPLSMLPASRWIASARTIVATLVTSEKKREWLSVHSNTMKRMLAANPELADEIDNLRRLTE